MTRDALQRLPPGSGAVVGADRVGARPGVVRCVMLHVWLPARLRRLVRTGSNLFAVSSLVGCDLLVVGDVAGIGHAYVLPAANDEHTSVPGSA